MTVSLQAMVQFAKFTTVALAGLACDLGLALTLIGLAGWSAIPAAVTGFCVGAAANYVLHEYWTFRRADSRLSARRGSSYLLALLVVLAVRLALTSILVRVNPLGDGNDGIYLVAATGMSFMINFLLSRLVVFRQAHRTPTTSME